MASSRILDRLPEEVLRQIAGVLHAEHPPSLSALLCVSRSMYHAAISWRLRNVTFAISTPERLREDVDNFVDACRRLGALQHVRWLEVQVALPNTRNDNSQDEAEGDSGNEDGKRAWSLQDFVFSGDPKAVLRCHSYPSHGLHASFRNPREGEDPWQPLVDLLTALNHLKDLVFSASKMLPPTVMEALRRHQPACRLHMTKFGVRSGNPTPINEHEWAVISSSQLHTICLTYLNRNSRGADQYMFEAAMSLVKGLTPNLKRLLVSRARVPSSPALYMSRNNPREPWKGFAPGPWNEVKGGHRQGSLEQLVLDGRTGPGRLEDWKSRTSFDTLSHLDLGSGVTGPALAWAAQQACFSNLRYLTLNIGRDDERTAQPDPGPSAIAFLNSLEPLEELRLVGSVDGDVFHSAISRHGAMLSKLRLHPYESMYSRSRANFPTVFGLEHVLHLQNHCHLLTDLTMTVQRSLGSSEEVETYEAFGKMRNLTTLRLSLNCSNPIFARDYTGKKFITRKAYDAKWMQQPFDGTDTNLLRHGDLYEMMMNCAVDEKLARSIWGKITQTKMGRPLQSLTLSVIGSGDFGNNSQRTDVIDVLRNLSRSYVFETSVRDDEQPGTVSVRELHKESRERREIAMLKHDTLMEEKWGRSTKSREPGHANFVFRKIWPDSKEGSRGWMDDWESFPLQR